MWEVVYQSEDYGGGYGFARVGLKMPDCHIVWLASTDEAEGRFGIMEGYAKEICGHMNSLNRVVTSTLDSVF